MLRSNTTGFVSKQVEQLIGQINVEGTRYDRELRSVHREKVSIPAQVVFDNGDVVSVFTRNLSGQGACIISSEEIAKGVQATLKLYRLSQADSTLYSECRWTKPFGDEYWVSGWQFLQIKRDG